MITLTDSETRSRNVHVVRACVRQFFNTPTQNEDEVKLLWERGVVNPLTARGMVVVVELFLVRWVSPSGKEEEYYM